MNQNLHKMTEPKVVYYSSQPVVQQQLSGLSENDKHGEIHPNPKQLRDPSPALGSTKVCRVKSYSISCLDNNLSLSQFISVLKKL